MVMATIVSDEILASWAQFGGGTGEGGLERVGVGKGQKRGEGDII